MPMITGLAEISLSDDNAAGFSSVPKGSTQCLLTVEDNAIRWGSSDSAPTASTGKPQQVGDELLFVGNNYEDFLKIFQIINDTAGSNGTVKGVFMTGFDKA